MLVRSIDEVDGTSFLVVQLVRVVARPALGDRPTSSRLGVVEPSSTVSSYRAVASAANAADLVGSLHIPLVRTALATRDTPLPSPYRINRSVLAPLTALLRRRSVLGVALLTSAEGGLSVGVKVLRGLSLRRTAAVGSNVALGELRGGEVGRCGQGRLLVARYVAWVGRESSTVVARRGSVVQEVLRITPVGARLLARVEVLLLAVVGIVVLPNLGLVASRVARLFDFSVASSVSSSADVAVPSRVKVSWLVVVAGLPTLTRERLRLPLLISLVGLLLSLFSREQKRMGQLASFNLWEATAAERDDSATHPNGSKSIASHPCAVVGNERRREGRSVVVER